MAKNVTHGIKDTWLIENQSYAGDDLIITWERIFDIESFIKFFEMHINLKEWKAWFSYLA